MPGSLVSDGGGDSAVDHAVTVQQLRSKANGDCHTVMVAADDPDSQSVFKSHSRIMEEKRAKCRYNNERGSGHGHQLAGRLAGT
jgi:hypothetical protein